MTTKESFSVNGEALVGKIKELIHEGNVTRITITDKSGKEIMSFPLAVYCWLLYLLPLAP
jgi:hypothetical protein